MQCPHCNTPAPSEVIDSRHKKNRITRRRQCSNCGKRYSTDETVSCVHIISSSEDDEVLAVISSNEIIEKNGVSVVTRFD